MSSFDVARRKPNFRYGDAPVTIRFTFDKISASNNFRHYAPVNSISALKSEFLCTGVVGGIDTANGWCYISCSKCTRKLQRGLSSFACTAFMMKTQWSC
ncbi:hypothetical protein YC2023_117143 [Brassica napus]